MTEVRDRIERALAGEAVVPPVTGVSFVDPSLLGAVSGEDTSVALARACANAHVDFAFVPSWEPWAVEASGALRRAGVAVAWVVPGVLWPALEAIGLASGLRAMATGVPELRPLLDVALASALRTARAGVARADVLVVAEDLAGAAGPLIDPTVLEAEVFPRLALLAEVATAAGNSTVLHCDGDARSLMPAIRAAGFVGLHGDAGGAVGIERSLAEARQHGLAFIGGLPTATLSDSATARAAGVRAGELAHGGGLLIADDGGVTTREEVANLMEVLRSIGGPGSSAEG